MKSIEFQLFAIILFAKSTNELGTRSPSIQNKCVVTECQGHKHNKNNIHKFSLKFEHNSCQDAQDT